MSWFARSIANTLQLDLDNDDENNDVTEQHPLNNNTIEKPEQVIEDDNDSPLTPGRGVKEDLSEITKTLTRQFWGVASFLAPPPSAEPSNSKSDPDDGAPEPIAGIRRDFAEIGGRFRSGISKLSNNIDVSDITKLASNFLQLSPDDDDDDYMLSSDAQTLGVTDEVVAFVRDITMHPETWLDFPLPDDDDNDDSQDFELSDAQQQHALTVESLAPRLAALRIELCPGYMSESNFWKIYFVLLHPRLEPQAAELLSTPEVVKARAALKYELKGRTNMQTKEEDVSQNTSSYSQLKPDPFQEQDRPVPSVIKSESVPLEISKTKATTSTRLVDIETEKHPIPTEEEVRIVDKSVIQEEPRKEETKTEDETDKDEDDWLKEDNSENVTGTTTTTNTIPIENDEDVSFSDLEDDDGDAPPTKDSPDWVQLGSDSSTVDHGQVSGARNSEGKGSSDWLDVDDIDVA
ncbi:uncharacterized protein [Rutidosis leptorrhynchoides]|uniref:uncharacterized protein n=1 Tax=Rutidosis leptorrhynchoides TaxID=125765 RepID=UPI003A993D2B